MEATLAFLDKELGLGPDFCELAPSDIQVVRPNKGGRPRGEVAVTFPDVETRDHVRSSARNLAGKTSMGIRLEIPEHLRPSLRSLESISFDLKKRVPGMKRNIKFDDAVMDLVLDVKLGDDKPWQKIRPENARAVAVRRGPRLDDAGHQEELDPLALETVLGAGPGTGSNATPVGPDPMDVGTGGNP